MLRNYYSFVKLPHFYNRAIDQIFLMNACNNINFDAYNFWTYVVKKKIRINVFMYIDDRKKMKYVLSHIKNFLFDVFLVEMIDVDFFFFLNTFFKKIESYLKLTYFSKNAQTDLRDVNMKKKINNEMSSSIF